MVVSGIKTEKLQNHYPERSAVLQLNFGAANFNIVARTKATRRGLPFSSAVSN